MPQFSAAETLAALRATMRGILLLGLTGTAAELLLIGHVEDTLQVIPLVALAVSALATIWVLARRVTVRTTATRLFRAAMVIQVLVGGIGSVLHYRANMEFKLEMDPSMHGFALFWSVMQAKAPPALAPGTMALLGLLGLASTCRLDPQSPSS